MPSSKISALDLLIQPTGLEQTVVAASGLNRRVTLNAILTLVNKTTVGLSNVDNTSDINKPISTAVSNALSGKAAAVHTHVTADTAGLQTALDSKSDIDHIHSDYASLSHVHAVTDVAGLQTVLNNKTELGHTHSQADVGGLIASLDSKANIVHGHDISAITGLQSALTTKADVNHNHAISDVADLQISLDGKSAVGHAHELTDVSGLQTTLDDKATVSNFNTLTTAMAGKAAFIHNHATTDVLGLAPFVQSLIDASASNSGGGSTGVIPTDNFGFGAGVLANVTTGQRNTALGDYSLNLNTIGVENTAVGAYALNQNTDGFYNTAIGFESQYFTTNSSRNTSIGYHSLYESHGNNNTAIGAHTLEINGGQGNTAVGLYSLSGNALGNNNVAIGRGAVATSLAVSETVAVGYNALNNNTTGINNTAIGSYALVTNNNASDNTAVGIKTLYENFDGAKNTAVGSYSLNLNIDGSFNSAFGTYALQNNSSGSSNTAVGYNANFAGEYTNTTALGANTALTADNQVQLGSSGTTTYVYGTVQNRSDLRDKADVRDTTLGLNFINSLRPVDYKWDMREDYKSEMPIKPELPTDATEEEIKANDNAYKASVSAYAEANKLANISRDGSKKRSRYHHGLIAQEVQRVIQSTGQDFGGFQNHAASGGEDVLSIGYDELIAPLIKAVQELSTKIMQLETQLANKG